jgi:hypothetical protein
VPDLVRTFAFDVFDASKIVFLHLGCYRLIKMVIFGASAIHNIAVWRVMEIQQQGTHQMAFIIH